MRLKKPDPLSDPMCYAANLVTGRADAFPYLLQHLQGLIAAQREIEEAWEGGDLADAVNEARMVADEAADFLEASGLPVTEKEGA